MIGNTFGTEVETERPAEINNFTTGRMGKQQNLG
jgi:hypothetical protein